MTFPTVEHHVRDFFFKNKKNLTANYPGLKIERILSELETLAPKLGMDRRDLLQTPYCVNKSSFLSTFFEKLERGVPLEYILGVSFFYNSELVVSPAVLIPRSETELLVEMAVKELKSKKEAISIAEVGIGSGAVALSILREISRPLEVIATDISPAALEIAKINQFRLSYTWASQSKVSFKLTDRLEGIEGKRDLIVTNPPYIKATRGSENVHTQVDQFEPHTALYLPDNEYEAWFKKLFSQVYALLKKDGLFLMEGHEDHLEELKNIMLNLGFPAVTIVKDYTRRDRFLSARK